MNLRSRPRGESWGWVGGRWGKGSVAEPRGGIEEELMRKRMVTEIY